jgi:hypothetical protein
VILQGVLNGEELITPTIVVASVEVEETRARMFWTATAWAWRLAITAASWRKRA